MTGPPADAELARALAEALGFAGPETIASLERRPGSYRSSSELEELDVRLADGSSLALMFKDYGRPHTAAGTRLPRPDFLYDPRRSIAVHQKLLANGNWGTPVFYGATVRPEEARYWLFVERVEGAPLDEVGDWSAWEAAASWLGVLHREMRQPAVELSEALPLLTYDAEIYRTWMRRALAFAQRWPAAQRERLAWLSDRHEAVVARLLAELKTLVHGDFHASNVLIVDNPRRRVCPVDWELAGIGPGLLDLAALASGGLTDVQRRSLAAAYYSSCAVQDQPFPTFDHLLRTLDFCLLQLSIQWLGWDSDWVPPPDQAQDWLADAERQAERLSL